MGDLSPHVVGMDTVVVVASSLLSSDKSGDSPRPLLTPEGSGEQSVSVSWGASPGFPCGFY